MAVFRKPALRGCQALTFGLALLALPAGAQQYPSRPVRVIVSSPAGGGVDLVGRPVGQKLTETFGQQFVFDNRPGASGVIANEAVAKAAPDGYTLLLTPGSFIVISPHLTSKAAAIDPLKLFTPITQINSFQFVLVVHPSVPATTVKELIAFAKARPRFVTFASSGIGSNFHLTGEMFRLSAGIELWHVPYKGSPPAIVDLLGGRVDSMFIGFAAVLPHIRSGRLRALGVTGSRREALLPDVPTIAEAALPGYEMGGWEGFLAPAGTPREVIDRLSTGIARVLAAPDMKELWRSKGMEATTSTPEQFAAKIRDDYEKNGRLIKAAHVVLE